MEDPLKEWEQVVREVHELYIKGELKLIASEIAEAEKSGSVTSSLQERFASLSRQLPG